LERPLVLRTSIAIVLFGFGLIGSLGLLVDAQWAMLAIGLSALLGLPVRILQAWALLVAALPLERPTLSSPAPKGHELRDG
jgi:hypothetical protein